MGIDKQIWSDVADKIRDAKEFLAHTQETLEGSDGTEEIISDDAATHLGRAQTELEKAIDAVNFVLCMDNRNEERRWAAQEGRLIG